MKIWDGIVAFFSQGWVKAIIKAITSILGDVLKQVGKEALEKIRAKILEVSATNMSNKQKFDTIFNFVKSLVPGLKDSAINLLIETLYNQLKTAGKVA